MRLMQTTEQPKTKLYSQQWILSLVKQNFTSGLILKALCITPTDCLKLVLSRKRYQKLPEAKRTSSLVGRKCRCEFAKVLWIENEKGQFVNKGVSEHDNETKYETGKMVYPDSYNDDIRVECTNGIHFFITYKEAKEYWLCILSQVPQKELPFHRNNYITLIRKNGYYESCSCWAASTG